MISKIAAGVVAVGLMITPPSDKAKTAEKEWKSLGECRITTYCPKCNEPEGWQSSSGKELRYGDCACSWLPIGTKISVEGDVFTVVDICGTDAIDIFIDTDDEVCRCNMNEYREVAIQQKEE